MACQDIDAFAGTLEASTHDLGCHAWLDKLCLWLDGTIGKVDFLLYRHSCLLRCERSDKLQNDPSFFVAFSATSAFGNVQVTEISTPLFEQLLDERTVGLRIVWGRCAPAHCGRLAPHFNKIEAPRAFYFMI